MNALKTFFLLASLTLILVLLGDAFGGRMGMTFGLLVALLLNGTAYWFSDRIVLKLHRARPLSPEEAPEVHEIIEGLAAKVGIPKPRVYLIPTASPNAFATGRGPGHAAVAVTEGILRILDREELAGVLAHELSHVLNRDILVSTVAAVLAGAIMYTARIAQWSLFFFGGRGREDERGNPLGILIMAILAPIAAFLIQLWISRTREYMADERGARLMGRPDGLMRALEKIHRTAQQVPMPVPSETVAHLYFARPRAGWLVEWLSTHPPIEKRIARLRHMFYSS